MTTPKIPFQFRNAAGAGPVEILIYEQIGQDWWTGQGATAKSFAEQLAVYPLNQEINVRINSSGGDVHEGLGIHSQLQKRKPYVTSYIDGVALSTAGWIAMAGKKVVMPKNAMLMLHNPEAALGGDSSELRKMADVLDVHKKAVASIFVEKTGISESEIFAMMDAETWMTGEEALANKFADELTAEVVITNSTEQFSMYRNVPKSIGKQSNNNMNTQNPGNAGTNAGAGVATPTPAAIGNTVPSANPAVPGASAPTDHTVNRLAAIEQRFANERRARVTNIVDQSIRENRIPAAQRDAWINRAVADETDGVITDLAALPQVLPGAAPVGAIEIVNESGVNLGKEIVNLKGKARAAFYNTHRDRIRTAILNANTLPSQLQRVAIGQETIRAFANILMPLRAFSTVLSDIPLEGTDKIEVPYYGLQGTASTDFVAANGYVMGNTATSYREITIDKRKYQAVMWTSSEVRRQPYLKVEELALQAAVKLGYDVVVDILSVVTAANYSTAASIGTAANFDSADVLDIKLACDQAQWPDMPRALFMDRTYENFLLKDTSVKNALNYGGSNAIQEGKVPRIAGFDFYANTVIPANAENLKGFAVYPSGILVASAPIQPTDEVRSALRSYETITDAATGATFEHRVWGNPDYDQTREVIECNYGFAKGEAAAVKRITSA